MKRSIMKNAFFCMTLGVCMTVYSCGDNGAVFPIDVLPDEMKETFSSEINVMNTLEQSKTPLEDTAVKPNDILGQNSFNVYFDNTTGCFMEYVNAYKDDHNDIGYQMFAKTMTSFKDTFDCSSSYKTYTLQADSEKVLFWNEYSDNIFTNFGSLDVYTYNTNAVFSNDKAPVTMWLDEVRKNSGSEISVYISDLNEQNGLLSQTGTEIKELLNGNPEKDLLIISYLLPYKGEISSPTFGNEGSNKSQVESKTFDESVNRIYYALAYGDHTTLTAFTNKVRQGFNDINLDMTAYMYRDIFYNETVVETKTKNGTKIEYENFLEQNPLLISVLDSNGDVIANVKKTEPDSENKNDDDDSLFGNDDVEKSDDSDSTLMLKNLERCMDFKEFFGEDISGETYVFRNTVPDVGGLDAEVTLRLDNSDIYDLDFENASVYTYVQDEDSGFDDEGDGTGWTIAEESVDENIDVLFGEDTVTVKLGENLSSDTVPVIAVSVPVNFSYVQEKTVSDIINITPEFREWVNSCKVPDILSSENENEKFTKTYGFDSFMDKITGYKSIDDIENCIAGTSEEVPYSEKVNRINLIIVADERE